MDELTRKTLAAISEQEAVQPAEGPVVLSEEYLRLVRQAERLPANRPGADKTWTERVLEEWKHLVATARVVPPG